MEQSARKHLAGLTNSPGPMPASQEVLTGLANKEKAAQTAKARNLGAAVTGLQMLGIGLSGYTSFRTTRENARRARLNAASQISALETENAGRNEQRSREALSRASEFINVEKASFARVVADRSFIDTKRDEQNLDLQATILNAQAAFTVASLYEQESATQFQALNQIVQSAAQNPSVQARLFT